MQLELTEFERKVILDIRALDRNGWGYLKVAYSNYELSEYFHGNSEDVKEMRRLQEKH